MIYNKTILITLVSFTIVLMYNCDYECVKPMVTEGVMHNNLWRALFISVWDTNIWNTIRRPTVHHCTESVQHWYRCVTPLGKDIPFWQIRKKIYGGCLWDILWSLFGNQNLTEVITNFAIYTQSSWKYLHMCQNGIFFQHVC